MVHEDRQRLLPVQDAGTQQHRRGLADRAVERVLHDLLRLLRGHGNGHSELGLDVLVHGVLVSDTALDCLGREAGARPVSWCGTPRRCLGREAGARTVSWCRNTAPLPQPRSRGSNGVLVSDTAFLGSSRLPARCRTPGRSNALTPMTRLERCPTRSRADGGRVGTTLCRTPEHDPGRMPGRREQRCVGHRGLPHAPTFREAPGGRRGSRASPATWRRGRVAAAGRGPRGLREVRAEHDEPPPPGAERPERRVALGDDEGVPEVVVEGSRRALAARGGGDLVPDAARRDDVVAVTSASRAPSATSPVASFRCRRRAPRR